MQVNLNYFPVVIFLYTALNLQYALWSAGHFLKYFIIFNKVVLISCQEQLMNSLSKQQLYSMLVTAFSQFALVLAKMRLTYTKFQNKLNVLENKQR